LKILAIQFRYFGDTIMMVPSLSALRLRFPEAELHVLVPSEVAPLVDALPWITRVWPMARRRGSAQFRQSWPILRQLRACRFDRSIDFSANDRGAILSFLCGAKRRLGFRCTGGFWARNYCYTEQVAAPPSDRHECLRVFQLLSAWEIAPPQSTKGVEAGLRHSSQKETAAAQLIPEGRVLCHIASSQPKKEWAIERWVELAQKLAEAGIEATFSTGITARERALLDTFKQRVPGAPLLEPVTDLALYLAVLSRARAFISGDTGPMHFAAGLGVPTVAIFGPTSASRWGPLGSAHGIVTGGECGCPGTTGTCLAPRHCLGDVSAEQVLAALQKILPPQKNCISEGSVHTTTQTASLCKNSQKH
jgi:heptosyltransferase-3